MTARRFGWFEVSLALIAAVYLVQVVTPIRLDTDSVRYLMIAIGIADGTPTAGIGASTGYPLIVAALIKMGFDSAPMIVVLNLVSIALGMLAVWHISSDFDPAVRKWTVILTLLSFSVLRTVVMPNSEPLYFGASLVALSSMRAATRERSWRKYLFLLGAFGLAIFAIAVRLVGVALLPALLWSVARVSVPPGAVKSSPRRYVATGVAIAAAAAAAIYFAQHGVIQRYISEGARENAAPIFEVIVRQFSFILRALGVILVNAPVSRWIWPIAFMPFIGLLPGALLAGTFRNAGWRAPVFVYVGSYLAILLVWPFYAERLWMPIIPLAILHAAAGLKSLDLGAWGRRATVAVVGLFAAGGVACLLYMTSISLARETFRARYGFAGGLANPGHETGIHNTYVRIIVKRFDSGNPAWATLLADPAPLPGLPR